MDRQPLQQPFSRNTASPYGRTPFPPASNHAPFPPSTHAPQASSYPEHQRRPSDPPYYNPQRAYERDGPPVSGPGHSRNQSSSSIGHGTPVNRHMPPPSSPQQQAPQGPHHVYGPPPPRAPTVGQSSAFSSGRELPSLGGGKAMSIAALLGGAAPQVSREQSAQYNSPAPTSGPSSTFGSAHQSPRLSTSRPEYPSFRRPQTPEHPRQFEGRDNRANSAGSPAGLGHYTTPEAHRYGGTPQQSYSQRVPPPEERREPMRIPNPNIPPPRPSSQPSGYNVPPREVERPPVHGSVFGRRVDTIPRPSEPHSRAEPPYGSRPGYEERHNPYGYGEREREQREREAREQRERERARDREREELVHRENQAALQRERENRDRERAAAHEESLQREYAHQTAQRNAQAGYRPPEPREQPAWMRGGYEPRHEVPRPPPYEPIPERERPSPQKVSNGYEYPSSTGPQYHPGYSNEPRYGPPPTSAPQHNPPQTHYEMLDLHRQAQERQRQQQLAYSAAPPNGSYPAHDSPARRPMEESQPMQQQRSFLGVEINRKGRSSPLPQAVQGPQPQINGPGGEPSIKNEFGRMFSGIGSGVGQVPSPTPQNYPQTYAPTSGGLRREDLQSLQQDLTGLYGQPTQVKRRKMKDEERGDDESSTGRNTPSGRGKRSKVHNHHGHHHHHHHHRGRNDASENTSSPNLTPFKSARGATVPSPPQDQEKSAPTTHHHHVPRPHHHHINPSKPEQKNTVVPVPIPKTTIRSKTVIDSVANLPRQHLGHAYYHSTLKPVGSSLKRDFASHRGFASTPNPLPRFEGKDNCTFTIKVPKVYLEHSSLEEITSRKAVWGTDIYTDDSDLIAACIHQGWFRGAWPEDSEQDILAFVLDLKSGADGNIISPEPLRPGQIITVPPPKGTPVPEGCDCHITVLILPLLEKYGSTTRFGLKSREWGVKRDGFKSRHDGLSYQILSVRFVSGETGEESTSGGKRKSIMNQQLSQREREAEESWGELLMNGNGKDNTDGEVEESFERGTGPQRVGDLRGIGKGSWWLKPAPARVATPASAPATNGKLPEQELPKEPVPTPMPTINHPQPLPAPEIEPLDDLELASHVQEKSKSRSPQPPLATLASLASASASISSSMAGSKQRGIAAASAPEPIPETEGGEWVVVEKPVEGGSAGKQTGEVGRDRQIAEIVRRMVRNANQGPSASSVAVEAGRVHGMEGEKVDAAHEGRVEVKEKEEEGEDPDRTLDADVTME